MPRNFVSLFGSGGDVLPAAGGGGPALAVENTTSAFSATTASGLAILGHVVTSANLLLIAVGFNDPNAASNGVVVSVKWNTTESASLVSVASQVWPRVELWKLVNPTPGTHNIDIVFTGNVNEAAAGATGFIGANATLGTPTPQTSAGANPATVTFASGVGEIAYACLASEENSTITEDGTLLWEQEAVNSDSCFGAQYKTGAPSVTANWTQVISRDYAAIGVSVKPA